MFDASEMKTKTQEMFNNIPAEYADIIMDIMKSIEESSNMGLDSFTVAVKASNKGVTFEEQVDDTYNITESVCKYFTDKGFSVLCNYSGERMVNLFICWCAFYVCNTEMLKRCCEFAVKYNRENAVKMYNAELTKMSPEEFNTRGIVTKIE